MNYRKIYIAIWSVVVVVVLVLVFTSGPSKSEVALKAARNQIAGIERAAAQYQQFLNAQTGDSADEHKKAVERELSEVGLGLDALSLRELGMANYVHSMYWKDADKVYKTLQAMHGKEKEANALAEQYRMLVSKADMSMSPSMERNLALNVARNQKEEAVATERAHGVRPRVSRNTRRPTERP